jgi:hypothetical protein
MEFQKPPSTGPEWFLYPVDVQVIVLAAIALYLLFVLYRTINRRKSADVLGMAACRWRRNKRGPIRQGFTNWRCKACGVTAYSSDGKPPKECKRALKATSL